MSSSIKALPLGKSAGEVGMQGLYAHIIKNYPEGAP